MLLASMRGYSRGAVMLYVVRSAHSELDSHLSSYHGNGPESVCVKDVERACSRLSTSRGVCVLDSSSMGGIGDLRRVLLEPIFTASSLDRQTLRIFDSHEKAGERTFRHSFLFLPPGAVGFAGVINIWGQLVPAVRSRTMCAHRNCARVEKSCLVQKFRACATKIKITKQRSTRLPTNIPCGRLWVCSHTYSF